MRMWPFDYIPQGVLQKETQQYEPRGAACQELQVFEALLPYRALEACHGVYRVAFQSLLRVAPV